MRAFEITLAQDASLGKKLFIVNKLRNTFNTKLNLLDYTDKLDTLFIIFQCFPANIKSRKVETLKKMRRKTKTLELYLVLDYERIMQGTEEENLQHIKEVFLQGCQIFLKEMKGFDWNAFVKIAFPEQQKLVA